MLDIKQICRRLRLLDLIQEAGYTLQRSPALFLCACFIVAYLTHTLAPNPYWLMLELGLAGLALGSYLWKIDKCKSIVGYRTSILGYLALVFLCITAWGMRIDYARATKRFSSKSENLPTVTTLHRGLDNIGASPEISALLSGISLGQVPRTEEGRAIRQDFVHSGVAHLLAVSGFHTGVVAGILYFLLMSLPIGYNGHSRRGLILLGIWSFVALTGWAIPTVRAALMLSFYLIGKIISRPIRFSQVVALSAIVQFLYDPHVILSWSFLLSYAAVISIYIFHLRILNLFGAPQQPLLRMVWSSVSITLAAQIGVLPLCLYFFGSISWSFIWLSLPTTLLATLLIPLTLLFIVNIGIGSPLPQSLFASTLNFLGEQMLALVKLGSNATALQQTGQCPLWFVLLWWSSILAYALYIRLPKALHKNPPSLLDILT